MSASLKLAPKIPARCVRGSLLRRVARFAPIVVAAFFTEANAAERSRTPNVVIVLADDLGWGDLGCYGNKIIQTPNLDKFAQQGLRYTQCYSACAVCSPSRSAIQTGRTPYRNGVYTWLPENQPVHLRTSEITIAKLLHDRGYQTCHTGKWHLNGYFNDPRHPQPNDHGYDWWFATQNNAGPSHKNPTNFVRNGTPVGPLEGFSAPLVVDEAITWLKEKRDRNKPFFLTVWTHEPHLPIESDPKFMEPYAALEDPDLRQHHGNVTQLDYAFGKLMTALDDQRLTHETFVFFTADNGPEGATDTKGRTRGSTGGLRGRKRAVYEGGIRVAGLARWPGRIPVGKTCDEPIVGSDLFCTVCEITGTRQPQDRVIDGVSIVPTWSAEQASDAKLTRPVPLYWRCDIAPGTFKTAMRIGDWKILAAEDMSAFELYNVQADPKEEKELSTAEPQKFAEMQERIKKLNAEIEAEGPTWWKEKATNTKRDKPAAKPKAKPSA